jgi:nucleoside-diphosphate-sugar epimerase
MGDGQSVITEERQGKAMVDTALANKVSHFVYTSVDRGGDAKSAAAATYVPHFASKHAVEQHLFAKAKGSDMSYTVLRPAASTSPPPGPASPRPRNCRSLLQAILGSSLRRLLRNPRRTNGGMWLWGLRGMS